MKQILGRKNSFVISVLNFKGGSGKTTLSTNLASLLSEEYNVFMMDYDPQQSSMKWLHARAQSGNHTIQGISINGISELKSWWKSVVPVNNDILLLDSPAGVHSNMLDDIIAKANVIIIPILPSAHDMRSTANFMETLLLNKTYRIYKPKIAMVANRVKENFDSFLSLQKFLYKLEIPILATISDDEIYVKSADSGLGAKELGLNSLHKDSQQWNSIINWVKFNKENPN